MKTIKRLLSYMKYERKAFSLGIFLLIISTITDLSAPIIAQQVIDNVIIPAEKAGQVWIDALIKLLLIYGACVIGTVIFRYISFMNRMNAANGVVKVLRDQLYTHIQHLPIRYFDHLPAGKIVARITNDTENIREQFYANALGMIVVNTIYVIGAYGAIAFFHKGLALVLLLLIPLLYIWNKIYSKYAQKYIREERKLNSEINARMNESIQGVQVIQAFEQENLIIDEFEQINEQWYKVLDKYVVLDSLFQWTLADVLRKIAILLLLIYFSTQYINGVLGISIGMLYLFVDYITRLFEPINMIIRQMTFVQQAVGAGERIFEILDMPIEQDEVASILIDKGEVDFCNVSFGYTNEQKVLKDINMNVLPGEVIGLVGYTGSGKSTIMNLLFRFYDPQEGTICVDGQPITHFSRQSLRSQMGIVLQDPYLFSGTIASNIAMGNDRVTPEKAEQALKEVGGEELLNKFAEGIHAKVSDRGQSFSAGERQLISFARALALNPKILVLDEATSSVDTETENVIQHAMKVLQKGRTTFIIAHRLSTIQEADQILVLDAGEIVESGTYEELIENHEGKYYQMYQSQLKE
ncbi:ABC transporter ATP-binding protein [Allofustis seminis]|uniref:ABC transporter ATP-binding protein n=1 Tax=Allofustis seminis TaxID=166939 RepID=UPI00036AFA5D|nr:ABC transporter ATP-binding protein [Allofustis seminis]